MNAQVLIDVSDQGATPMGLTVENVTDIALLVVAVLALGVAAWRSHIADKEAETASQSLSNERFKSGVELLAHKNMAVRLGGVAALGEMARLQPETYHLRVMEIFAAFLALPPRFQGGRNDGEIDFDSADTVKIVGSINDRTLEQKRIEERSNFNLGARLEDTNFPIVSGCIRPRREKPRAPLTPRPYIEPTRPPSP